MLLDLMFILILYSIFRIIIKFNRRPGVVNAFQGFKTVCSWHNSFRRAIAVDAKKDNEYCERATGNEKEGFIFTNTQGVVGENSVLQFALVLL